MSRLTRGLVAVGGVAVMTAALTLSATADATSPQGAPGVRHACATHVPDGYATCFAQIRTIGGAELTSKAPQGYGPADISSAYQLPAGRHQTVAIVDAYDDPNAESDLAVYRHQYGLRPCTTGNGCFAKVDQRGGTNYPRPNAGWAGEISLDLDMVSAACPTCNILLVEANSPTFGNLGKAVNYAASQNVEAISNSYGGNDNSQLAAYDHPGIAITASTGDGGYGVSSPASFDTVVAVGGTSLNPSGNARGWTETAWGGAGSGCSTQNAKPAWQTAATQCTGKANADVSAVADPNTGVAVYDTYQEPGWLVFGGTSASAPIIASVYAMGGHLNGYPASYTWAHTTKLNDVKSGSNGICLPTVWCTAGPGWDGPTGLGTPKGIGSF